MTQIRTRLFLIRVIRVYLRLIRSSPQTNSLRYNLSWEAAAVFTRDDERLDHLRLFEVAAKFVQLVQPEREAAGIRIESVLTVSVPTLLPAMAVPRGAVADIEP